MIPTKSNIFTETVPRFCPALTEVGLSADLIPHTALHRLYTPLFLTQSLHNCWSQSAEQLKGLWEDAQESVGNIPTHTPDYKHEQTDHWEME